MPDGSDSFSVEGKYTVQTLYYSSQVHPSGTDLTGITTFMMVCESSCEFISTSSKEIRGCTEDCKQSLGVICKAAASVNVLGLIIILLSDFSNAACQSTSSL